MKIKLAFVLLLLGCCSTALAGMRCGNKLAQLGDSFGQIEDICGEPDFTYDGGTRYIEVKDRNFRYNGVTFSQVINVDVWVYSGDSRQFSRNLYFENGILVFIEQGDKD